MNEAPHPQASEATHQTPEHVAHIALALVADHPAQVGPMRCARIIGGFTVPYADDEQQEQLSQYAIAGLGWPLRTIIDLVSALEQGGLITRSSGPRPRLVLTRAGHRALDALDHEGSATC
jgi:hypothetical protein